MRIRSIFLIPAALLAAAAAACSSTAKGTADTPSTPATATATGAPAADVGAVRAAIEKANATFVDAFKRGDAAAATAYYDENAIVAPGQIEPAKGRAEVQKAIGDFLGGNKISQFDIKTEDVEAFGDKAIEWGSYSMTVKPAKGPEMKDHGAYMTEWKKQPDGSWKPTRDILSSSVMPPGMPPAGGEKK